MNCDTPCHESTAFLNLNLNDVATLLIALVNVILLFYIFIYQKKKDKEDHLFILKQIRHNIKSDWFKSIIIESQLPILLSFFSKIHDICSSIFAESDEDIRQKVIDKLNIYFNLFERDFISLLGCFKDELESTFTESSDTLREKLQEEIIKNSIINKDTLLNEITNSKRKLIKVLYNFKPVLLR